MNEETDDVKEREVLYDDLRILIELRSDLDIMYFQKVEHLEKFFALDRAIDRIFSEIDKRKAGGGDPKS